MTERSGVRSLLKNVLLLITTTVVCLALAEVGVRVTGMGHAAAPQLGGGHVYDSLLGWRNRPLSTQLVATGEYRITETFNGRGVRGPERAVPKPRGVRRVLLLGDSFAEAYTVDDDSTCAAVLERALNRPAAPVEVVNGGSAGYATDQELLLYTSRLREYQPDVVVLLFYVNDVWFNVQGRYWRGYKPRFVLGVAGLALTGVPVPPPQPDEFAFRVEGGRGLVAVVRRMDAWLGRSSALYGLLRGTLKAPLLSGTLIRLGFAAVPGEFLPWKTTPDSALASAWRVTDALLARLRDEVQRDGARLIVFHVPPRPAVYDDDWRRTRRAYAFDARAWSPRRDAVDLGGICRRQRLQCVFPEAAFRREAARIAPAGGRLYFAGDAHWTAAGNALAARLIAEALSDTATAAVAPDARPAGRGRVAR